MGQVFIRTNLPEEGNVFYNKGSAGVSTCCYGNAEHKSTASVTVDLQGNKRSFPFGRIKGLNVLPNCVGFACGAFNETVSSVKGKNKQYYALNCNAKNFLNRAETYSDLKPCVVRVRDNNLNLIDANAGQTPTLGSIMVWTNGTFGHVAYVCKVDENDRNLVYTAESNWSSNPHFTVRKRYRNQGSPNNWGTDRKYSTFIGFIKNPVVKNDFAYNYYPYIKSYKEEDNVVKLNVVVNGEKDNKYYLSLKYCFYNEDEELNPETLSFRGDDGFGYNWNSEVELAIPDGNKKYLQVIVTHTNIDTNISMSSTTFQYELKVNEFVPAVNICNNSNSFDMYQTKLFKDGTWKDVQPYVYSKGIWLPIRNKLQ